jgi:hypothetical protein
MKMFQKKNAESANVPESAFCYYYKSAAGLLQLVRFYVRTWKSFHVLVTWTTISSTNNIKRVGQLNSREWM